MVEPIEPGYEVESMHKRPEPDGNGNLQDHWTVHYKTHSGVRSHVKLPATHMTAHNVHTLITHEMRHIHGVQQLGINPPPVEG